MTALPVYNIDGEKVGDFEVDPSKIAPKISKQLLHDAVVMYLANKRQGSAKTKTRAEVAGSTKKMYRQKGTGNARAGSRRSPVRRGGGHANARSNRNWGYRLNKKAIRSATMMAILMTRSTTRAGSRRKTPAIRYSKAMFSAVSIFTLRSSASRSEIIERETAG